MSEVTVSDVSERYKRMLEEEGFKIPSDGFKTDDDGDVQMVVKVEGMTYVMIFEKDDPKFIRIILPNFYTIESDDQLKAFVAVNHVAKTCKGAKVHLTSANDDMMAIAEFLDNGTSLDQAIVTRYFSMVRNAAKEFAAKMEE